MKCQNIIVNTVNPVRNIKYPPVKRVSISNLDKIKFAPLSTKTLLEIEKQEELKKWYPQFQRMVMPNEFGLRRFKEQKELSEMFVQKPELIATLTNEPYFGNSKYSSFFLFSHIKDFFENYSEHLSKIKMLLAHKKESERGFEHIFDPFTMLTILKHAKNLSNEEFKYLILINPEGFDFKDNINLLLLSLEKPEEITKIKDIGVFDIVANKKNKVGMDVFSALDTKSSFSPEILKDFEKLRNGETNVIVLSNKTKPQDIKTIVEAGDVCEINKKLYIHDGESILPIKLSKEKFEELFPIYERNLIKQGKLGDCWILAGIDALISNQKGKSRFYKLFEQDGNDILIKFPNAKQKVRFKNGEALDVVGLQGGAKGYKLVEQAYMIHRNNHYTSSGEEICINDIDLETLNKYAEELKGGYAKDAINTFLGYSEPREKKTLKSFLKNLKFWENKDDLLIQKTITEGANNKNFITYLSFYAAGDLDRKRLFDQNGVLSNHAYALKGYNPEKGTIELSNPHNTNVVKEVLVKNVIDNIAQCGMIELQPLGQEEI